MTVPVMLSPALIAVREQVARLPAGRRALIGIAGPPGAGKSTLAEALAGALRAELDPAAVAVPMDGFHLSTMELTRLGLANRKGAPETFDSLGFVHLLSRLRADDAPVYAPAYSRVLHESIGGAISVPAQTRLVVVEGNYLLLPDQPWARVRELLDLTLYLDAPSASRRAALLRRQRSHGRSEEQARDWVERSDDANARLIETTRPRADQVLTRPS